MKDKWAFIFLCCLLLFVSCQQKQETFTIGFSQCSDDEWRRKMNTEMRHEAMLHPDISLEIKSVTDDTEKQIEDIQYFIDRKVDLIIVSPNKAAPVSIFVPISKLSCKAVMQLSKPKTAQTVSVKPLNTFPTLLSAM